MLRATVGPVLSITTLLLASCGLPLVPDGRPRDPEGLEAQRQAGEAIEAARDRGASLKAMDDRGWTPLYRAPETEGSFRAIERLIAAGAKADGRSRGGETALFAAMNAWTHHAHGLIQPPDVVLARVRVLLDAGADPNARNDLGETVLIHAVGRGWGHGADRERLTMLLDRGARLEDRDPEGRTPLMRAADGGRFAELLVERGADIHARDHAGRSVLSWAAASASPALTENLLGRGAVVEDPDGRGWTPLMHAVEARNDRVVRIPIGRGADPGRGGWTPLMLAAITDDRPAMARLIAQHADVNARDHEGRTALH